MARVSRFSGEVIVRLLPSRRAGRPEWELVEPIVYDDGHALEVIDPGARTNWGDIPWLLTWLFPAVTFETARPFLLHDHWLRHRNGRTRARIDGAFRHALKSEGNSAATCWLFWTGVRLWAVVTGDK